MKITSYAIALCSLVLLATASHAQQPRPSFGSGQPSRPLSPYLNINRGGNTANNYYNLVKPQIESDRAFQALGNNLNSLKNTVSQNAAENQSLSTGHRSSFMTHNQYFMNNGSTGGNRSGSQQSRAPASSSPKRR